MTYYIIELLHVRNREALGVLCLTMHGILYNRQNCSTLGIVKHLVFLSSQCMAYYIIEEQLHRRNCEALGVSFLTMHVILYNRKSAPRLES